MLSVPGLLLGGLLLLLVWTIFREIGFVALLTGSAAMLWPARRQLWARQVLGLLVLLGSLWILHKSRVVVYPLLVGLLVAYWLDPLVDRLEKRGVPRNVGALVAILPVLILGTVFGVFVLPSVVDQLAKLFSGMPVAMAAAYDHLRPILERYLPDAKGGPDLANLLRPISGHMESILKGIWGGAAGLTKGIGAVLGVLAMAVLAPILTYYLLADFDKLTLWARRRIPAEHHDRAHELLQLVAGTISSYYRGQVLVALAVAILLTIGFLIIGLPYAIALGFLAGLLNLIPVLGFWTVAILCAGSAILSGEPGPLLVRLAIVFAVEQVIEAQILTPRIIGKAVGLHPALTLVSVLVFGAILGPIGVIVAVPLAAILRGLVEMQGRRKVAQAGALPTGKPV